MTFSKTFCGIPLTAAGMNLNGLPLAEMREAIGAVCVHWSLLEFTVEHVIAALTNSEAPDQNARNFHEQLNKLCNILKEPQHLKSAEVLLSIIDQIKVLGYKRHRAVHGLWGRDQITSEIVSIFRSNEKQNANPVVEMMSLSDLENIKRCIWQLILDLAPHTKDKALLSLVAISQTSAGSVWENQSE